jgi:tetratricopeptide (TPR) repeat protein
MLNEESKEKNSDYYLKLGKSKFEKKRYSKAERFFDEALKLNPKPKPNKFL